MSWIELKQIDKALTDETWLNAMKKELDKNLVEWPKNFLAIKTKWIIQNKNNKEGKVIRNKVILVMKGYFQQEGID